MKVNWRSQLTFMATAEDRASISARIASGISRRSVSAPLPSCPPDRRFGSLSSVVLPSVRLLAAPLHFIGENFLKVDGCDRETRSCMT